MGKYTAHRIDHLPPEIRARINRAFAALFGDVQFTEREIADASAELEIAPGERQASLNFERAA